MNAYETAQALGLVGKDAEIVAQLTATGLTESPIMLDELLFLLNSRNMLSHLYRPAETGEKWGGSIIQMMSLVQQSGNTAFIAAMDQWFSHITNPRNIRWDTTNPSYAAACWAMYITFKDSGLFKPGDFEAVAALGGGWKFSTLTVEEYAVAKKEAEDAVIAEELQQVASLKQSYLAEANDTCIHLLSSSPETTQDELLAAFKTRLSEVWV